MKTILIIALLLASVNCIAQETPKIDISKPPTKFDLSGKKPGDQSNGAANFISRYTATATTGFIFNIAGSAALVGGFAYKPKDVDDSKLIRNIVIVGGGLNLIGFVIHAAALSQMNKAAVRLFNHKHTSFLINENGIGLQLAIN